jgi:2-octaprenyl-6-methoxyphenol hydroxylase
MLPISNVSVQPLNQTNNNILISGAGPVGLFCALKFAHAYKNTNKTIIIIDPILHQSQPWLNQRTIALSYGSIQLLQQVGISAEALQARLIKHVHISIDKKWGACNMNAEDYNVDALGYVVSYKALCELLYQACLKTQKITFLAQSLQNYSYNESNQEMLCTTLNGVNQQQTHIVSYLIISEGQKNNIEDNAQNNKQNTSKTIQYAHVGWASISKVVSQFKDTAFERFTQEGPIALLPYDYADALHNTYNYALVWCNHSKDNTTCNAINLQKHIGWHIGKVDSVSIEQNFTLNIKKRDTLYEQHCVFIGNNAQSLHPVAGQGLNLGFRQVHVLCDVLSNNQELIDYATRIQSDRSSMLHTTSIMSNIFSLPIYGLNTKLGIGLQIIDILPTLKKKFAQHFMYGKRT